MTGLPGRRKKLIPIWFNQIRIWPNDVDQTQNGFGSTTLQVATLQVPIITVSVGDP
jgi:hypothetical protein